MLLTTDQCRIFNMNIFLCFGTFIWSCCCQKCETFIFTIDLHRTAYMCIVHIYSVTSWFFFREFHGINFENSARQTSKIDQNEFERYLRDCRHIRMYRKPHENAGCEHAKPCITPVAVNNHGNSTYSKCSLVHCRSIVGISNLIHW